MLLLKLDTTFRRVVPGKSFILTHIIVKGLMRRHLGFKNYEVLKWEKSSGRHMCRIEFLSARVRMVALALEKLDLNEVPKWEKLLTN